MGLLALLATGTVRGDGAQMPRALFEADQPGAANQLKVGGGATGQVTWKLVENGFTAKLTPGASAWPGVIVVPPANKPNWDLSLWGHVEAKVTNLGADEFQIFMRVDNPAVPGKSPWNTEPIKLKGGASTVVKVYFGYSFYHQPNYKLDPSNVVRVQFFLGNPKAPVEFKVGDLKAAGWDGEKPGVSTANTRQKPDAKGYVFKDARPVSFASGGTPAVLIKPQAAFWDLSADMQVRVAVKNTGKTSATPRLRIDSVDGSTDEYSPDQPIAPGGQVLVTIPFAPKVPWTAVQSPDQLVQEKGGRWDRQPSTGTAFRNHKVKALAVFPDPKVGAQNYEIIAMKSENPPAKKPAWLGQRPPVPGKWKQTLAEEFDGKALNDKIFGVRWFNFWDKRQHFSAENTFLRDGKLVLRAEHKRGFHNDDPDEAKFPGTPPTHPIETDWQVGWADTFGRFTQRYGYWEFRLKLPRAACLWPGIWLMPDRGLKDNPQGFPNENWQHFRNRTDNYHGGMEIDIVEAQTMWGPHRFNTACHWDGYGKEHKVIGTSANYVATDEEGFITVGLLWLPGSVTCYGNGEVFWKWESPRVMSVPAYLQLQNQIGGWECDPLDASELPSDFEIDYVRVWQREDLLSADEGLHETAGGPDTRRRDGGKKVKNATSPVQKVERPPAKPLPPPAPSTEGTVRVCRYLNDAEAAFMLAFDDGCVSHLQNAIPLLEKYRMPGTFYLITEAGQFTWKKADWAKAAKSPYVFFGNHTSTHKGINAPDELYGQAEADNRTIRELTPDRAWPRLISFAVPGGVPWRIDKTGLTDILSAYDLVERPNFQGPPWFCSKIEEAEAYIDRTLQQKTMGHLDFHGIGGDWHVAGLDYFERVLKRLDAYRARMWLCSAIDWHKYVTESKYAQVKAVPKGEGAYAVSLSVAPLDAKLYDHPLTVLVDGRIKVSLKPGETKLVKTK